MNNEIKILTALLEKPERKINYKNRRQGYGLRAIDFTPEKTKLTRSRFNTTRKNLLKTKMITRLKEKSKRDKHYSITPLGIAYLLSISTEKIAYGRIFKILNSFYEKNPDSVKRRFKPIPENILGMTLGEIEKQVDEKNSQFKEWYRKMLKNVDSIESEDVEIDINHMKRALEIAIGGIEVHPTYDNNTTSIIFSFTDISLMKIILDNFYIDRDGKIADVSEPDIKEFDSDHLFYSIASEFVLQYFYHILIQQSVNGILNSSVAIEDMKKTRWKDKEEKERDTITSSIFQESIEEEIELLKKYGKTMIENNLEFLNRIEKIMQGRLDYIKMSRSYLRSKFV
jgi:hypothetical protein